MAQTCLKCLKYTMCLANFLCFICGVTTLGLGVYLTVYLKMTLANLGSINVANIFLVCGIVITCVAFLGFLGALKENRCLLLTFFLLLFLLMLVELTGACLLLVYEDKITDRLKKNLNDSLAITNRVATNTTSEPNDWDPVRENCCGFYNDTYWGAIVPQSCCTVKCELGYWKEDCFEKLNNFFEENFLMTGIAVIIICIVEVLAMCFAMTLFCHISRSGLGYKL
ncbi:leukocyte surface antigen CD53-like [Echeneis naucrates]|uniref:Tetraspanin n=1 Tax=Echeneis naucrates TaxID=173247 RepID=A0A665UX99_ECHNA|nr:leukocyte surface antigen CD53-like [Echeneis naucrates]XP_029366380.1 leukocyte surface antigen CD53-like [Echeneis naucrates]